LVGQALICARIPTGSPLHFRYVGRRVTCRRIAVSTSRTGLRDGASISRQDARSANFFTARLDCDANEEEGREGGLVALDLGPEIPFVIHTVSGYRRSGKVGTVAKKLNCTQRLRICSEPLQGHLVLSGLQHGCQVLEITFKPHRGSRGVSRFLVPNSLAAHHKVSKAALVATALWPLALIVVSHKKYMGIQETRYIQGCN
jgi:hypothetical protein